MLKLRSHDAIDLTDSFVFTPGHCVNFRMMRYESTGFNRIIVDNLRPATLALGCYWLCGIRLIVNFSVKALQSSDHNTQNVTTLCNVCAVHREVLNTLGRVHLGNIMSTLGGC